MSAERLLEQLVEQVEGVDLVEVIAADELEVRYEGTTYSVVVEPR